METPRCVANEALKKCSRADHCFLSQWAESLFKELDYRKEAANGLRFRELYGNLEARFVVSAHCIPEPHARDADTVAS